MLAFRLKNMPVLVVHLFEVFCCCFFCIGLIKFSLDPSIRSSHRQPQNEMNSSDVSILKKIESLLKHFFCSFNMLSGVKKKLLLICHVDFGVCVCAHIFTVNYICSLVCLVCLLVGQFIGIEIHRSITKFVNTRKIIQIWHELFHCCSFLFTSLHFFSNFFFDQAQTSKYNCHNH